MLKYVFSQTDGQYICRCSLGVRKFEKNSYMGSDCYRRFEHLNLRVPGDYDMVLRTEYGDYMQIPPEDKRGVGHEQKLGKIIYDCHKDYREYRKELADNSHSRT